MHAEHGILSQAWSPIGGITSYRDGASGTVGMRHVAQQPPDGLTLGITPMTPIVVQPHMVRNLGIGPDSFAPVCGVAENILGVVVRACSPSYSGG